MIRSCIGDARLEFEDEATGGGGLAESLGGSFGTGLFLLELEGDLGDCLVLTPGGLAGGLGGGFGFGLFLFKLEGDLCDRLVLAPGVLGLILTLAFLLGKLT